MESQQNKISLLQIFLFIVQTQVGVGILSLPHDLHMKAKGGAWISVFVAGIVIQLILLIYWLLLKRFPKKTVFEITIKTTGLYIGGIVIVLYSCYFILVGGTAIRLTCDVLKRWMLQSTPTWAVVILIIITSIYLARENSRTIARYNVLLSILIIPMFFLILYGVFRADFSYPFPIFEAGWINIIKSAKEASISMYGFEIILILFPLVIGSNKSILKTITYANWFVTIFFAFIVFTCLVVFSPAQLEIVGEPVVYLLRSLNFGVVSRIDLIFLPIWMTTAIASIVSYLYFSANGIKYILRKSNHKNIIPFVAITCSIISLLPQTPNQLEFLMKVVDYSSYVFLGAIPVLLLLISFLFFDKEGGLK